ncbi:MAG: 3-phosphoserine/phosphohydroxythreonine transaminase [Bacteroidales bacterium]|nr:3-phosphoserine/phosphohydroxythreonine transaminase [Bacteroidales bacterium]
MKKHNFYAGPSILPESTVENTIAALKDFSGTGLSLMEISHRSKQFVAVVDEAVALFKELLNIPEGYSVIFVGGGASLQFCMVPYNLLGKKAAYLNTGEWSTKAIKEAKMFGEVDVVASSEDKKFNYIPKGFKVPADADYFHITTNNTIYGTEILHDMEVGVPLVADMSSDIFSRVIDVTKYAIIYGGAQKNLAPAGVTFAIVKDSILGKVERTIPTMLKYSTHISKESMFNTPPVVPIFAALQTLKWIKQMGGVAEMEKINIRKSNLLYSEIDRNSLFQTTVPLPEDRSRMNVCFIMTEGNEGLEKEFNDFATEKGMIGLKGHRSAGGFRASLYNALPYESVEALVAVMKEFEASKK